MRGTIPRMYMWKLVGHDTAEGSLRSGIGGDLAAIMRTIEGDLTNSTGFVGHVAEVVSRMSVFNLGAVHVPTGREWLGRRDKNGGVYWKARYRPVDPDVAYNLAALHDLGSVAS